MPGYRNCVNPCVWCWLLDIVFVTPCAWCWVLDVSFLISHVLCWVPDISFVLPLSHSGWNWIYISFLPSSPLSNSLSPVGPAITVAVLQDLHKPLHDGGRPKRHTFRWNFYVGWRPNTEMHCMLCSVGTLNMEIYAQGPQVAQIPFSSSKGLV
jgi:hypothetical protein